MIVPSLSGKWVGIVKGGLFLLCVAVAIADGIWLMAGKVILFALIFGLAGSLVLPKRGGLSLVIGPTLVFVIFEANMPVLIRICVLVCVLAGFIVGEFLQTVRKELRRMRCAQTLADGQVSNAVNHQRHFLEGGS